MVIKTKVSRKRGYYYGMVSFYEGKIFLYHREIPILRLTKKDALEDAESLRGELVTEDVK